MAQYIVGLASIDPGDSFLSNNTRGPIQYKDVVLPV